MKFMGSKSEVKKLYWKLMTFLFLIGIGMGIYGFIKTKNPFSFTSLILPIFLLIITQIDLNRKEIEE